MNRLCKSLSALLLAGTLGGCATAGYYGHNAYPYRGTLTGAAVGAAGGALLGYAADGGYGNGALLGGTLGALAGGATGYYFDRKRGNPYDRPYYDRPYGPNPPPPPRRGYRYR